MATFRWPNFDPFSGLRYVQREMDRLMGRVFGEAQRIGGGVWPPVNVLNGPDEMVVECEVPGVRKEDLDLSITGDTLVIKGVKHGLENEDKLDYQRRERGMGDFSRTVVLPDRVDPDKVDANLEGGVLTIRLAKSEAAKPRKVTLK
jgi:HSP20 family protein